DVVENGIEPRNADRIALDDGCKDQQRRRRDQARDQNFFKTIENTKKHLRLAHLGTSASRQRATPNHRTEADPTAPVQSRLTLWNPPPWKQTSPGNKDRGSPIICQFVTPCVVFTTSSISCLPTRPAIS